MKEICGDLFNQTVDAICITTNGICKLDPTGKLVAVMGAGVAGQAAEIFPDVPWYLANRLMENGHHTQIITQSFPPLTKSVWVSFPTKFHWKQKSTIVQVIQSCEELVELANEQNWQDVILPRPGCGLGGLNWYNQVRPEISKILDDRFSVITF